MASRERQQVRKKVVVGGAGAAVDDEERRRLRRDPDRQVMGIDYANVEACAKVVAENADLALGVKVRITDSVVGQNGLEPLRRAVKAAELAGKSRTARAARNGSFSSLK